MNQTKDDGIKQGDYPSQVFPVSVFFFSFSFLQTIDLVVCSLPTNQHSPSSFEHPRPEKPWRPSERKVHTAQLARKRLQDKMSWAVSPHVYATLCSIHLGAQDGWAFRAFEVRRLTSFTRLTPDGSGRSMAARVFSVASNESLRLVYCALFLL